MNKVILSDKEMDPAFVRSQFDEILVREITSLIEIDSDIALLTYNLSTISTIIIAVEQERAIRNAKGFPPKRFTFNTLIVELIELGLSKDDTLLKSVESVITQGYLTQNSQRELKAEVSAYTIVGFLDKMFPGMEGIQLIAFVMQMIDEVLSERKSLDDAKDSFSQALKKSGVTVTREKAEKKAKELALDASESRHTKDMALKLKEANIKRLAQQRLRQNLKLSKAGGKPSFHFDGGSQLDKVRVTSVFNQGPSIEEIEAKKREKADAERQYRDALLQAAQIEEQERKIKEAEASQRELERKTAEIAAREQAIRDGEMAALRLEQQQAELRAKEAEMAAREAELKLREEQLKAVAQKDAIEKAASEKYRVEKIEAEKAALGMAEKDRLDAERDALNYNREYAAKEEREQREKDIPTVRVQSTLDDIASRIAAFEAELTIPCPLCNSGVIKKERTENGKEYFICSDRSCRFVSWSQPYHFPCPLCKNSFLVDFQTSSGARGLKCPRASCSFSQNNLSDPSPNDRNLAPQVGSVQPSAYGDPPAVYPPIQPPGYPTTQPGYAQPTNYPQQTSDGAPPKKKRLVRRVKRTS